MFELEVNHDRLDIDALPDPVKEMFQNIDGDIQGIALIPWEEHCTECAMPGCYETCDLYEPRKDGKCRRFSGGIAPVPIVSGIQRYVVRIRFKRWGQLMAYANIHMIPRQRASFLERGVYALDEVISRVPDQGISIRGRRSISSRLTRRLKQFIAGQGYLRDRTAGRPDYFLVEVYNPNPYAANLSLTITNTAPEQYDIGYQKLITLKPGFSRLQISVPDISERVDLNQKFGISFNPNILDEKDEGLCLYFGMLTFVWDPKFSSIDNESVSPQETNPRGKAPYVKVVAWDLDNTLWDGILLEDGADKLRLKPGIVDIIKQLDERGILNTVVSKNNPEDALAQLEKLGISEYFLFPKIGWDQKGQYLKSLVKQFNVGEDTFAFIDDSPFERDEALSLNPKMRVYDASLYSSLLDLSEFNPPVSAESGKRRLFYKSQGEREHALTSFNGDYLVFLKSCHIQLNISSAKLENSDRIQELVQRTNQLNFSGNRYSRDEISHLLSDSRYDAFSLDCEDKYGKYGTVGFALVDKQKKRLIDLMFSCRVQSKRVEHAFLAFLLTHYKEQGYKEFSAVYNQTERNIKAGAAFKDMKFTELSSDGPVKIYGFDLQNPIPADGIVRILWNGKEWAI